MINLHVVLINAARSALKSAKKINVLIKTAAKTAKQKVVRGKLVLTKKVSAVKT